MGNPVVVAAQMAAHGDEVARLRAELHAARAAAEQSRLRVEAETAAVEARAERDQAAALLRRASDVLGREDIGVAMREHPLGGLPTALSQRAAVLADARAFLEGR